MRSEAKTVFGWFLYQTGIRQLSVLVAPKSVGTGVPQFARTMPTTAFFPPASTYLVEVLCRHGGGASAHASSWQEWLA